MKTALLMTLLCLLLTLSAKAQEKDDIVALLGRSLIGEDRALEEIRAYLDPRFPRLPKVTDRDEWERAAERIRKGVLENVIYRGEARRWREAPLRVVWDGTVEGGRGYEIRKLRYESLPGLWVPAILYVPDSLKGRVPVHLAVNGHEHVVGKAAEYKQVRCINLAKRGMIVLNIAFLGMGQLKKPGFVHNRANQLNLCGTNGVAPFYLTMERGLDILLSLEHADPARVAVHGLSGGGWQTILISALDPRVTFANPVAGYSSFRTQIRHRKDLADSEQAPCDLATIADYTHLTALRAPRPTLLTYNARDNCCYEAAYALPPLTDAAARVYRLYGKQADLTIHVNHDPGDHNFLRDNRQALYRAIGRSFFPGDASYNAKELDAGKEIKTKQELAVSLPADNQDFHSLATALARTLPRSPALPQDRSAAKLWSASRRHRLREVVRAPRLKVESKPAGEEKRADVRAVFRRLSIGEFTVPSVELAANSPKSTVLMFSERGRQATLDQAAGHLAKGRRVIAFDPFYFGESTIKGLDFPFALYVSAVGERPLGIQAGQVAAIARWAEKEFDAQPVTVTAVGPRASLIALVAAGLETNAIAGLELHNSFGSLKEVIEKNLLVNDGAELFCFGLLESFDILQLAALVAPRPVSFRQPGKRVVVEMGGLNDYYRLLGADFDPLR